MHQQLTLELSHIPSLDGEDFLVSASNEQAAKLVNSSWSDCTDWVAESSPRARATATATIFINTSAEQY